MRFIRSYFTLMPILLLQLIIFQDKSCETHQITVGQKTQNTTSNKKEVKKTKGEPTLNMKFLPEGVWGGQHISLSVTENGAILEFDCGHGRIDQKIEFDNEGRFDVKGMYAGEKGGPSDKISASNEDSINSSTAVNDEMLPARYTGYVTKEKMVLTIRLTDTGRNIGSFNLIKDAIPKLFKCL